MKFIQNKFEYDSTIKNGRQEVFAEGDVIVPDTEPDILSVYQLDGSAVITDITPADGKISAFGKAFISILYAPDSDSRSIGCINTKLDFSFRIDNAAINEDTKYIFDYDITSVEHQIINSRKLRIKACICVRYVLLQPMYAMLPAEGDGTYPLNFKKSSICVNNVLEVCYAGFDIAERFELDAGQPSAADIIKASLEVTDHEHKLAGNKIIFKCICTLTVLYRDAGGEYLICEKQFPFSDICSAATGDETAETTMSFYVGDVICDAVRSADGEARAIDIKAQLYTSVMITQRVENEYISDCYISARPSVPVINDINITEDCGCEIREINIREALTPPDNYPAVSRIYKVSAVPAVTGSEFESGKCTVSGSVCVYVSYLTADGGISCFSKIIPFEQTLESGNADSCDADAQIRHCTYSMNASSSIDVRILLEMRICMQTNKTLSIIDELDEACSEDIHRGIKIYFADDNESLWDIGKKFLVDPDILNEYDTDTGSGAKRRIIVPML